LSVPEELELKPLAGSESESFAASSGLRTGSPAPDGKTGGGPELSAGATGALPAGITGTLVVSSGNGLDSAGLGCCLALGCFVSV
jgi:hypothetical protein